MNLSFRKEAQARRIQVGDIVEVVDRGEGHVIIVPASVVEGVDSHAGPYAYPHLAIQISGEWYSEKEYVFIKRESLEEEEPYEPLIEEE